MTRLVVSDNKRFLQRADGTPFFYMGDTDWELFHRLTQEEAEHVFDVRKRQGFTVVQAVALAEFDGLGVANAYGHLPLEDKDPTRPNEAYFDRVDRMVQAANDRGLVVGFLPTWGDKWHVAWGGGPEIFTEDNARIYGRWLGERYRNADLIWILGGDRPIKGPAHIAINRAMAEGLAEGDGGTHLRTFHPCGGATSSEFLHHEAWLDFNAIQSGHGRPDFPNYEMVARDYELDPPKPVLDMEPRYEDHPVDWKPDSLGFFTEIDVREGLYWAVFAGGCGVTYGCHDVWQMWDGVKEPVAWARTPWPEALELPVANQVKHLRALIESRPYFTRIPGQDLIDQDPGEGADRIEATRCEEGSYAFVYLSRGGSVSLNLPLMQRLELDAAWYSPRDGEFTTIGRYPAKRPHMFEAPSAQDWVLVLDDPNAGFEPPEA